MTSAHRTVMITGAAGHLGRAVAETFDTQGAALVLLDRSADRLQQAFGGPGQRRLLLPSLTSSLPSRASMRGVD